MVLVLVLDDATAKHGMKSKSLLGFNKSLRYKEGVLEAGEEVSVCGQGTWEREPSSGQGDKLLVIRGTYDARLLVSDDVDIAKGTFSWQRRRRKEAGECVNCGYDVRGKFTHGCPECGWRR